MINISSSQRTPEELQKGYVKALDNLIRETEEYGVSKDIIDALHSFPTVYEDVTEEDKQKFKELHQSIKLEVKKNDEWFHEKAESKLKYLIPTVEIYKSLLIKKKTKPKGSSKSIKDRNQAIVDKCYELEKKDIKARTIYENVAEDYPTLSWHAIKKIRLSPDAPTPTSLKM